MERRVRLRGRYGSSAFRSHEPAGRPRSYAAHRGAASHAEEAPVRATGPPRTL